MNSLTLSSRLHVHTHTHTHGGGEMGSSDSANQRPLLLSILSMLLEGRGGCRGTRQSGGGKSWQICGGQGRQAGRAGAADYSGNCQLQCLQSGSNRFRVGGGGSHCRFLSSQPVPVCLPAEWDDIREGDGGNVPPPHPLLNNSSARLGLSAGLWLQPCRPPFNGAGDYQHRHLNI